MQTVTLADIAAVIDIEIEAAIADIAVTGINSPEKASADEITFIASETYLAALAKSQAAAVILTPHKAEHCSIPCLVHPNPYLAYAKITALFAPRTDSYAIHPQASIADNVNVGERVCIGANTVIETGVVIADDVRIHANVSIGRDARIGQHTEIYPNATVYHDVEIGADCILHAGTVIGSDGFGYAPSPEGWQKIHQLGKVKVGNRVEIGANTAIDRGAIGDTIIKDGVKIDNLVHISHNVVVGEGTAIAAQCGIAGSTKIGKRCMFGGQVGITGHIEVTDSVQVTGQGMITKSITEPGVYSSGTSFSDARSWRKNTVRYNQLDAMFKRLLKLEKTVDKKSNN